MNWNKMLFELLRTSNMKQVAEATGINFWTIRRIKRGELRDPRYSDAVKLESYYYKTVNKL